jgi:23S rRNA (uridine2552-2'-O)-methyltransferase
MKKIYSQKDYYSRKAKEENYPARSVYKLEEIDKKYNLIKKGDKVLDLGCAPGSWLIYIAKKVGDLGRVVGVDFVDLKIKLPQNVLFLKKDVMNFVPQGGIPLRGNVWEKYDAVVSDLAPSTSGIDFVDAERSLEYCERALKIAQRVLEKGGNFVCKIFEGEGTDEFFKNVKKEFEFAKKFKPKASRKWSREIYIVGKGFLG